MIRPALKAWGEATNRLLQLSEEFSAELRDETIAEIDELLNVRDQLQQHIQAPFTEEEEVFGKQLVELEKVVQQKLQTFTNKIRIDINKAQSKKGTIKNYVNPYSNLERDGTMYDKRK